jgi:O-antigen/teichoic acid export membrane protein
MSSRKPGSAVQEGLLYGAGTVLSQGISALRGLVIAGLLGPKEYGLWKSLQVVLDYMAYTHFGVLHGLARELPGLSQGEDRVLEARTRRISFWVALGTSFLAGVLLVAATAGSEPRLWHLWFGIAGLLVGMQLIRYQIMVCQATGALGLLGLADVAMALVSFGAMWWWVPRWGIWGVFAGLGAGISVAVLLGTGGGVFVSVLPTRPKSDTPPVLRQLLWKGFPFMAVDGLFVVWQRIDRVALILIFGAESEELGYYGLAVMVASFAVQVPQILMRVLFRRTLRDFDREEGSTEDFLNKHLWLPWMATALGLPLLFAIGATVSNLLVAVFLPEYVEAQFSILLLLGATYWCGLGLSVRNLFTARNAQWRLGGIYLGSMLLTFVLAYLLAGLGIEAGAFGMLAGSGSFAVMSLWDNCRYFGVGRRAFSLFGWGLGPSITFGMWAWWFGPRDFHAFETMSAMAHLLECLVFNGPWFVLLLIQRPWRVESPSQ